MEAEIDWRSAPKDARWSAVDRDGRAYWYCAPHVVAFADFWYAETVAAPLFSFAGDWRKSLVERPD